MVPFTYTFNLHERFIIKGKYTKPYFAFCLLVALSSIPVLYLYDFNRFALGMTAALSSPFVHIILFRKLYAKFVELVGRPPVDVAFNFKSGLAQDRLFAFTVVLGFIFLSFFIVGFFHWGLFSGK